MEGLLLFALYALLALGARLVVVSNRSGRERHGIVAELLNAERLESAKRVTQHRATIAGLEALLTGPGSSLDRGNAVEREELASAVARLERLAVAPCIDDTDVPQRLAGNVEADPLASSLVAGISLFGGAGP